MNANICIIYNSNAIIVHIDDIIIIINDVDDDMLLALAIDAVTIVTADLEH